MATLMLDKPILVISGTNRPDANALKVANIVMGHYRAAGVSAELFSLADMPQSIFEPSSYATKPEEFVAIQQTVLGSAGLHIVTPEYNGSFPGVLKYFIDMLKFPDSFEHKCVAFVGEAAGIWGALRSVEQLSAIFAYRNAYVFPERVFIPGIREKLDAQGRLIDPAIDGRLAMQAAEFTRFVDSLAGAK